MIDFTMPSLGADMESGKIVEWFVAPGSSVQKGDIVADVETEKGVIEIESWHSGVVSEICADIGEEIKVGELLARIDGVDSSKISGLAKISDDEMQAEEPIDSISDRKFDVPSDDLMIPFDESKPSVERIRISPLAKKMAGEYAIDLSNIRGSGYGGVIRKDDVFKYLKNENLIEEKEGAPVSRRIIAQLMSKSHLEIPHYYLSVRVSVGNSLDLLNDLNKSRKPNEHVLIVALFLKAIAMACREFPDFNGFWVENSYHVSAEINIGLSIHSRTHGLVAPSIKAADKKSIFEISSQVFDMVSRLREGKLRRDEMVGGSITCTHLGERGVDDVFGLIYPPQVSLVGIGSIFRSPAAFQDKIGIESFINLSFSGDHRAHDGHRGSLFLREIKNIIEQASYDGEMNA